MLPAALKIDTTTGLGRTDSDMLKSGSPPGERNVAMVVPQSDARIVSQSLSFYYGAKQALFEINIEIPVGEVTALIGPSGCGKSTFLRSLNRMNELIPNTRHTGSILIAGVDIYNPNVNLFQLRKEVGMVFQRSNPFPKSIFENVAYGLKVHGFKDKDQIHAAVEESLVRADLWREVRDRLSDSALALSGGQQQRLCIARALAVDPEILLMDEPASALDPRSTSKIEELIVGLKGDYTIVIVTHNMHQAARVSDNTAFFYEGSLIEYGLTKQLFTKPTQKRTEDYITGRFG